MGKTTSGIARTVSPVVWLLPVVVGVMMGCGGFRGTQGDEVYTHRVKSGETLSDIAEDYYGDASRAGSIASFNELGDEDLRPGMRLRIPLTSREAARLKKREEAREPFDEGMELVENASFIDAIYYFQQAIKIDRSFADAHFNLGVTYQKVKSYDRALERFREAVRLRPGNAAYFFALGNSYFYLERYERAVETLERVMQLDNLHAKAQYSLGVSYEKLGEVDKARAAWERYLLLDNKSAWASEARKRLKNLK